jgi:hypothetical protein
LLCVAGEEAALLVRDSWTILRLNPVARDMWRALETPMTSLELATHLQGSYDVAASAGRVDILPTLLQLEEAGALLREGEASPAPLTDSQGL